MRSLTTEWKKQRAKMIDLNSDCFDELSHTEPSRVEYARSKLALRPLGGSFVSLMDFWRIGTGTTS